MRGVLHPDAEGLGRPEGEGGDEFSMAMIFGHECIGTPAFMAPEQAQDSLMPAVQRMIQPMTKCASDPHMQAAMKSLN